jgi:hypothetical protein
VTLLPITRRSLGLLVMFLWTSGCAEIGAVHRLSAGPDRTTVSVVRPSRTEPLRIEWHATREPREFNMFTSVASGSATLPELPPGCEAWELRIDVHSQARYEYQRPGELQIPPRELTGCGGRNQPSCDARASGPESCWLRLVWAPDGNTRGVVYATVPGGEERELFSVPEEDAAVEPKLWANLLVSPVEDAAMTPLVGVIWLVLGIAGLSAAI